MAIRFTGLTKQKLMASENAKIFTRKPLLNFIKTSREKAIFNQFFKLI
jgi:hypothetical protein